MVIWVVWSRVISPKKEGNIKSSAYLYPSEHAAIPKIRKWTHDEMWRSQQPL